MTANRTIRRSEKLPRGSYFFLRVGHRYYAGEQVETEEVTESKATLHSYDKGGRYRSRWAYEGWGTPRRLLKRFRKSGRPKYMDQGKSPYSRQRETETVTRTVVGSTKPILTDDFGEVKQFRRRKQAEEACKKLEAMYRNFDVKVSVKLYEGE